MLSSVEEIRNKLQKKEFIGENIYFSHNGRKVSVEQLDFIPESDVLRIHERLLGGKGGFGSMLRAIGSQIEKTTNHEMCRDLTGRRMRDVNAEKKLREWYEKATDREREKAKEYIERRKKRQEILQQGPLANHKFEDPKFMRQKEKISADLQDALESIIAKQMQSNEKKTVEERKCKTWLEKYDEIEVSTSEESDQVEGDKENGITQDFLVEKLESIIANFGEKETSSSNDAGLEEENTPEPVLSEDIESKAEKRKLTPEHNMEEVPTKKKTIQVPPLTEDQINSAQTAKDFESYGLDSLKSTLTARGLKCGGSLSERALRLFLIRNLEPDQYPKHLLAKLPKNVSSSL